MQLFFTTEKEGNLLTLNEEESRHATKVLRLKPGSEIEVTDGTGVFYSCRILEADPRRCVASIVSERIGERRPWNLHIGIAPTKNTDRLEWFLEKATEIGIDEITPVICEHSERDSVKNARLGKILVSAVKQSLRATLPKLNLAIGFSDFVDKPSDAQKFIAYCGTGTEGELSQLYRKHQSAVIMIGPEGDFTPVEVSGAIKAGFIPVKLGNSRLRTETAGIVACHTINLLNQ